MATDKNNFCPPGKTDPDIPVLTGENIGGANVPNSIFQTDDPVYQCSRAMGMTPIIILKALRIHLIRQFQENNVRFKQLLRQVWSPLDSSALIIETNYKRNDKTAGDRPTITLSNNSIQSQPQVLGDIAGHDEQNNTSYQKLWIGSTTLFCLHSDRNAAEYLGLAASAAIAHFAPVLRRELGLFDLSVVDIGKSAAIKEFANTFGVPVTVGWAYIETWTLEQEAPRLRNLTLTSLLQGTRMS